MTEQGFTIDYMWHFGRMFITLPTSPVHTFSHLRTVRKTAVTAVILKAQSHAATVAFFSCCETAVRYSNNKKIKR